MKLSSDVNVVFAYDDRYHLFHKPVVLYLSRNKRNSYLLLSRTKAGFIYTYKDYLTTCGAIIDKAIRGEREKRSNSPSKSYKPSPFAISKNVDKLIDTYIDKEKQRGMNFNISAIRKFINVLLTDYSIPELYENEESFAAFREKYLVKSEEIALDVLNKFLEFFQNFESINIEDYGNPEIWLDNIRKSKKDVFENKQDYEDMKLAAEFLSFNGEFGILGFFTSDKNCYDSIKVIAEEYNQKVGHIQLIKKTS